MSNEKLAAWNAAFAAIHPQAQLDHSSNDRLYIEVPNLGGTVMVFR